MRCVLGFLCMLAAPAFAQTDEPARPPLERGRRGGREVVRARTAVHALAQELLLRRKSHPDLGRTRRRLRQQRRPLLRGLGSHAGEPLKCDWTDPAHPPAKAKDRFPDNDGCIVLIPHLALKPDTIYDVKITATVAGKDETFSWSFRTKGVK